MFIELHERGAGDGFCNGGDDVDGLCGRRLLCSQVGEAIGILPKDGRIVDDAGGHAWIMTDVEKYGDKRIKGCFRVGEVLGFNLIWFLYAGQCGRNN